MLETLPSSVWTPKIDTNGLVFHSALWRPAFDLGMQSYDPQPSNALSYDGNDYLTNAVANFRSGDGSGTVEIWFRTTTTGAWQTLFSSADEGSATRFIYFLISTSNKIQLNQRSNDADDQIIGTTTVTDGKWHHAVFSSNGIAYSFFLDGAVEEFTVGGGTDSGDWFADTALRDNITVGVIKIDYLLNYFTGAIGWTRIYSRPMLQPEARTNYSLGRQAPASDATGLVFNLPLTEGTGNPVDTVALTMTLGTTTWIKDNQFRSMDSNRHLMTNVGATWDKYGRDFDGINNWITMGDQPSTANLTFIAWVKTTSGSIGYVASHSDAWGTTNIDWALSYTALLVYRYTGLAQRSFTSLADDTWHHIAFTISGTAAIVYRDTVAQATLTVNAYVAKSKNLKLGARAIDVSSPFLGIIGEASYYSRALSAAEIYQLYQSTKWRYNS